MGAWGTAIFSNDTSTDVRGDFRDAIGAGETAESATIKILCGPIPDAEAEIDPDDNDIWFGLAATQHKTGHIVAAVIERALRITESQDELERWELPTVNVAPAPWRSCGILSYSHHPRPR